MMKAALFPKLGPSPLAPIQCCFKGNTFSALIQHCMDGWVGWVGRGGGGGGGRVVKLSEKAKCTMTFDQDCSSSRSFCSSVIVSAPTVLPPFSDAHGKLLRVLLTIISVHLVPVFSRQFLAEHFRLDLVKVSGVRVDNIPRHSVQDPPLLVVAANHWEQDRQARITTMSTSNFHLSQQMRSVTREKLRSGFGRLRGTRKY